MKFEYLIPPRKEGPRNDSLLGYLDGLEAAGAIKVYKNIIGTLEGIDGIHLGFELLNPKVEEDLSSKLAFHRAQLVKYESDLVSLPK